MIRLENVSKIYYSQNKSSNGLIDVSLTLPNKGLVAIIGPSGCGKTTLLNLLGGLDVPTSGSLYVNDVSTSAFSDKDWNYYRSQKISYIYQYFFLMQHLTVKENIGLSLFIQNKDKKEIDTKVDALLAKVNLKNEKDKMPHQLSGGQQQRVAIARAIIHNPGVILADEPTGSLDDESSVEIMNILKSLSKEKLVVMVTHNKALAIKYADQIIEMKDSKIVHAGLIESKKEAYNTKIVPTKEKINPFLKLSFKNLLSKKFRTIILAIAASISVIGISLVIALSRGFNYYIEKQKRETLTVFPLRVESTTFIIPTLDPSRDLSVNPLPNIDYAIPYNLESLSIRQNTLNFDYYQYVQNMPNGLLDHIHYGYGLKTNFIVNHNDTYKHFDVIEPFSYRLSSLYEFYEPVAERMSTGDELGLIIVIDRYNRLPKDLVQYLGFSGNDTISFETLLNLDVRWVPNNTIFDKANDNRFEITADLNAAFHDTSGISLPVLSILRMKDSQSLDAIYPGVYYSNQLTEQIINTSVDSEIVIAQKNSTINVITGQSISNLDASLRRLGYATYPNSYLFYPISLESKDLALAYLRDYNKLDHVGLLDTIEPFDLAGVGLATLRVGIDSVSSLLLMFAVLSLVITNVLLGLITYHSVIERVREIGILRALGSSRKQIGILFYAEAINLSLFASLIGIVLTYALLPFVNFFFFKLTSIRNLSVFRLTDALLIVILAVFLSSLFSIIPAIIASRKQPIDCL
ncbi:MAG: ATP-binding cassette domain-containing protein, partial [Acholeplasmataceae bacterium]